MTEQVQAQAQSYRLRWVIKDRKLLAIGIKFLRVFHISAATRRQESQPRLRER